MRSAVLLVSGLLLLVAGITVVVLEVPGRWFVGPVLVVVGIALKLAGMLRDPRPAAAAPGRTKTTLGTAPSMPPASGAPVPARAMTTRTGRAPGTRPARQTGQTS